MNARHTVRPGFPEQHRQGAQKQKHSNNLKSNLLGSVKGRMNGGWRGVQIMGTGFVPFFCLLVLHNKGIQTTETLS